MAHRIWHVVPPVRQAKVFSGVLRTCVLSCAVLAHARVCSRADYVLA